MIPPPPAAAPLFLALAAAAVFAVGDRRARRAAGRTTWAFGRSDGVLDFLGRAHRAAAALALTGLLAHAASPWLLRAPPETPHPPAAALAWLGLAAMAVGAGLVGWAQRAMGRSWRIGIPAGASAEATALVASGPFAVSRNPTFLGLMLLLGGAAAASPGSLEAAGAAAAFVALSAQIRLEEAHLAARHGDAYAAYAARVRRWL